DLLLADHEAAGLARIDAVAVDLALGGVAVLARVGHHPVDRLFTRPARMVDAGVDDHAAGPEKLPLQITDPADRIALIGADFVGQLLGVERPAFGPGRETDRPPEQRQLPRLPQDAVLEMVPRHAFVVQESGNAPQGVFLHRAQVDVDDRRLGGIAAGAVEAAGRAVLDGGRDATHLDGPI